MDLFGCRTILKEKVSFHNLVKFLYLFYLFEEVGEVQHILI